MGRFGTTLERIARFCGECYCVHRSAEDGLHWVDLMRGCRYVLRGYSSDDDEQACECIVDIFAGNVSRADRDALTEFDPVLGELVSDSVSELEVKLALGGV